MPVHQRPSYVPVVGRHLFPHVYHKVDKMKLFSASRWASRALAMVRLSSNCSYHMYSAMVDNSAGKRGCTRPCTTPCGLLIRQMPPFCAQSLVGTPSLELSSFNL